MPSFAWRFFVDVMRYIKKDRFQTQMEKSNKVLFLITLIVFGIVGLLWTHYLYFGHIDDNIEFCYRNREYLKYAVYQYNLKNKDKQIKDINEESIKLLLDNKYLPLPLGKTTTPCKYYITNNNSEFNVLCNFHNGK